MAWPEVFSFIPSITVTEADGEGAVVEHVVLCGESVDRMRTKIVAPTATIQV